MDSIEKLTTAISMVEEARGVPLSASCVLHRSEILEVLDGARAALPNDLDAARKILASRDSLIEEGRLSAEALIASAREEVSRMIEQTAIVSAAREEAQHILDDAHLEADQEREEVEKYIDSRLATLEVILNKTSDAIARGRERLAGAGDKDVLSQLANDK
jgi:F0F1-type ATP synthase membrane subunit b/b'